MAAEINSLEIRWEPIGKGTRARLTVARIGSDVIDDIEVIDLGRWRERHSYAHRLVEDGIVPWSQAEVERELLRIAGDRCGLNATPAQAPPTLADALDEWEQHEVAPTIVTGFQALDSLAAGELPGGLALGTITVLLGPPAAGKSALALQLTVGALLADEDVKAAWCLGEMTRQALATRAIAVGSVLIGDGSPVTAKDVVATMERLVDPKNNSNALSAFSTGKL